MTVIKSAVVNTGSSNYHFRNLCFIRRLLIIANDFSIQGQKQQQHGPGPEWPQAGSTKRNTKQADQEVSKKSNNMPQQPPSQAEPNESSFALVIICHCLGERKCYSRFWRRMQKQRPPTPPTSVTPPSSPTFSFSFKTLSLEASHKQHLHYHSERICLSVLL